MQYWEISILFLINSNWKKFFFLADTQIACCPPQNGGASPEGIVDQVTDIITTLSLCQPPCHKSHYFDSPRPRPEMPKSEFSVFLCVLWPFCGRFVAVFAPGAHRGRWLSIRPSSFFRRSRPLSPRVTCQSLPALRRRRVWCGPFRQPHPVAPGGTALGVPPTARPLSPRRAPLCRPHRLARCVAGGRKSSSCPLHRPLRGQDWHAHFLAAPLPLMSVCFVCSF